MRSTVTASNYAEHGYLVVRNTFSRAEVEPLLAEATRICRGGRARRMERKLNRERLR